MTTMEKIEIAKSAATIIAALIVVVGGAVAYGYQRSIDRRDKLREKKQQAYEAYLHKLYEAAMEGNRRMPIASARAAAGLVRAPDEIFADEQQHDMFQKAKLSVFVLAPDQVIRAAGSYQKLIESIASGDERKNAFAKMVKAMRADSFESTGLTVQEIADLSPINHPNSSAVAVE